MRTALVLGGGAARGAYEAGVVSFLRDELPRELDGLPLPLDIVAGTSVGAVNGCFLAATASEPATQGRRLVENWRALRVENVLRFGAGDLMRVLRELLRRRAPGERPKRVGLVDPLGLREIVHREVVWRDITRNIESGALDAISVTATHVASGRTTVFLQHRALPDPGIANPHYRCVRTKVGLQHAMASAAIPVLFPPVAIGGELYVDGGLRQNVPISPALRLGAERVLVVSLHHRPDTDAFGPGGELLDSAAAEPEPDEERSLELSNEAALFSGPFLLGKALNAMLLDRIDEDLMRLRRLNAIIEAGTRTFGPSFERLLDDALEPLENAPIRYVRNLLIHPSQDLGRLAAEYARSREFQKRAGGFAGRVLRRLIESEAPHQADLASYLMFDGGFADLLVQLGRADARAQLDELRRFFLDEPQSAAEEARMEAPQALA